MNIAIHWFRRDLRLHDNAALSLATHGDCPVLPLFIFDKNILDDLPRTDARVCFIHKTLTEINEKLKITGSGILTKHNTPEKAWAEILKAHNIKAVYFNHDYEPYTLERDKEITRILAEKGIKVISCKDQVIFEKGDVLKADGKPYTMYTPYKNKWRSLLKKEDYAPKTVKKDNYFPLNTDIPTLQQLHFKPCAINVPAYRVEDTLINQYKAQRDYPAQDATSHTGPHLRFGTLSPRELLRKHRETSETYINELIWREFFMQVLYHFPQVTDKAFKAKYDRIKWRNNESEFEKWCEGQTGYPLVDAGMRELNATGLMHNRVRMVTASFLCKHLLIDWRWGEAYFAEKLLDYDLAANNGNWQWAAGTGCDATPYFRIFNPITQLEKFDPEHAYIKKWVPEYDSLEYVQPMVEHKAARERALKVYKEGLNNL